MTSFDLQPTLTGDLVILRPLRESDFEALHAAASDRLIWEQHPDSDRHKREVFQKYFDGGIESGGAFAIVDQADGLIIGSSRYYGLDLSNSIVEIGWTFLARSHWGGRYNSEVKRLMIDHAFRSVSKVQFIVAARNIRSQTAVERLGALRVKEGIDTEGEPSFLYELTREQWLGHFAVEK